MPLIGANGKMQIGTEANRHDYRFCVTFDAYAHYFLADLSRAVRMSR